MRDTENKETDGLIYSYNIKTSVDVNDTSTYVRSTTLVRALQGVTEKDIVDDINSGDGTLLKTAAAIGYFEDINNVQNSPFRAFISRKGLKSVMANINNRVKEINETPLMKSKGKSIPAYTAESFAQEMIKVRDSLNS